MKLIFNCLHLKIIQIYKLKYFFNIITFLLNFNNNIKINFFSFYFKNKKKFIFHLKKNVKAR